MCVDCNTLEFVDLKFLLRLVVVFVIQQYGIGGLSYVKVVSILTCLTFVK